ncbi:MAG TPA: chromate resistance protein ChrB domain-containing protein [Lacunisphaera sp.]|jgi:hypothetical protein
MTFPGWLLLLYALPTGHNSLRVNLWRKLKKAGAVSLKTSASLLPDTPANYELFQWFAKQLSDGGGEATLIRTKDIENMSHPKIVTLFNDARGEDYAVLIQELTELLRVKRKPADCAFDADLEQLRGRFEEICKIDFFESPRAHDAEMLFRKAKSLRQTKVRAATVLKRADYQGRTWLTRPQPQIDRVGSAWLIKTFIDPQAKFVFSAKTSDHPTAVPYDMADVELTHQGDDCTFETLLKRFALRDKALEKIAAMVHDADLHDDKFHAPGADGIDRVLEGLARLGWADEKILQHGFTCFEALYAHVKAT